MKQKALLFAAALLMTASAFAQPAKPTVTYTSFADAVANATEVYLYNVDEALFLTGGNYWGTRAAVAYNGLTSSTNFAGIDALWNGTAQVNGYKWLIEATGETTDAGKPCYSFANKTTVNYLTADDWAGIWVDGGTDRPYNLWYTNDKGDNTFELGYGEMNGLFGLAEKAYGATGNTCTFFCDASYTYDRDNNGETETVQALEGAYYTTWALVTEEEYERVVPLLTVYFRAEGLKQTIEQAKAEYPAIDFSAEDAVYKNASATVEDYDDAIASISQKIVDAQSGGASVSNPADFTAKIVNPTFDAIGDFHGWSSGFGAGGTTSTNAEIYGKSFDVYQDIEGLPKGVYAVAVNGYTRYKDATSDYNAWKAGQVSETKVYINSAQYGTFATPVKHVSEGGGYTSIHSQETSVTTPEGTLYCPNTMAAADYYFHNSGDDKRYYNEAYGALGDGETLRLGVINQKATSTDWSIFDDFQLLYFGDSSDAYSLLGTKLSEAYTIDFSSMSEDVYYGQDVYNAYQNALSTLQNVSDPSAIASAVEAVAAAAENLDDSKAAYTQYLAKIADLNEWLDGDGQDYDASELADYLQYDDGPGQFPNGCFGYICPAGEHVGALTADQVLAEIDYAESLRDKALQSKNIQAGDDLTGRIKNAGFDKNVADWETTGTAPVWGGNNPNPNGSDASDTALPSGCAERYQAIFSMFQTLKSLPAGAYELSVQAFERNNDALNSYNANDPRSNINTVLFAEVNGEKFTQKVCNILEGATLSQVYAYGENTPDGNNDADASSYGVTGYIPDGMSGSNFHFQHDENGDGVNDYTVTLKVILSETSDMTIGIETPSAAGWVIWDNFRLVYLGDDTSAYTNMIDELITELENIVGGADVIGSDASTKADNAIRAGNQATTTDAAVAAIDQLKEAIDYAKASIAAYQALDDASYRLDEAYAYSTADEATKTEAKDLAKQVSSMLNAASSTPDQVNALVQKVESMILKLGISDDIDWASASDSSPLDLTGDNKILKNPAFDTLDGNGGFTAWTYTKECLNGPIKSTGFDGTQALEAWDPSAVNLKFDAHQSVYLPEGKYVFSAEAANSYNSQDPAGVNGYCYVYAYIVDTAQGFSVPVNYQTEAAGDGGDATGSTYYVTFTVPAGGAMVNVGFQCQNGSDARWFVADNCRLTYYGTNSTKTDDSDQGAVNIEGINTQKVAFSNIYTATGARVATLQKGINIVRMADGSVRKIMVK